MPQNTILQNENCTWIDLVSPSKEELTSLVEKYQLPASQVTECLAPVHLPKYEFIDPVHFMIFREYDSKSAKDADTSQELTDKIALFISGNTLITIHRTNETVVTKLAEKWKSRTANSKHEILNDIIQKVIMGYEAPVIEALNNLEDLELSVFSMEGAQPFEIKNAYFIKRRAVVFRRMLKFTQTLLESFSENIEKKKSLRFQLYKEQSQHLLVFAEDLTESVNSLLNLHISMASQKTNEASHQTGEVVRILTIFSIFLLPLNIVTGIYGMNFEHMPEIKMVYGYPAALMGMVMIEVLIFWWFRKKGWLKL